MRKRRRSGRDGLIAVCGGAGGHQATSSVRVVNELRRSTRSACARGAITNVAGVLAAEAMGCYLAYWARSSLHAESMAVQRHNNDRRFHRVTLSTPRIRRHAATCGRYACGTGPDICVIEAPGQYRSPKPAENLEGNLGRGAGVAISTIYRPSRNW